MATMYSLFLGFLLAALCRGNVDRGSVVGASLPAQGIFFLLDQKEGKTGTKWSSAKLNQGCIPLCYSLSKNLSKMELTTLKHHFALNGSCSKELSSQNTRPFFKASANSSICTMRRNVAFDIFKNLKEEAQSIVLNRVYELSEAKISSDKAWTLGRYQVSRPSGMEDKGNLIITLAGITLQCGLMSPVKHFAIKDDLLAYGVKGRKAITYRNSHFALGQDFQSKGGARGQETLETASVALLSRDEHRVNSLDLCGTFYQGKVPRRSANEDRRNLIITIASAELGIKEATGNNDGPRIEQYLRYTNLGPGYDWCAAFVSFCYGQAGLSQPRNPWSPALFPKARSYKDTDKIQQADLFGIYSAKLKRINHVGLIKEKQGSYILTIEGNSNNRVESRRRHQRTVYSYATWVDRS